MAGINPVSPPVDLEQAVRACNRRDTNREGIPMFLVLEDLTGPPARRSAAGGRLGRLAEDYLRHLAVDRNEVSFYDVATALEVLAAYHFDPVDGEGLVTDAATLGELATGPLVRAINFHNTPRARAAVYERQLLAAGERFCTVDEGDLDGLLSGRPWRGPKPPVIPALYEGYRNNYDVALPLLERAGLRGWFFVPTAFIDTPVSEQYAFARAHHIRLTDDDHAGNRCAMTWDELRDVVARGHVVACHTATHCTITDVVSPEDVQRELVDSRRRLEDELGHEVRTLAWLFGVPYGEDQRGDVAVREAGYQLVISNTKIQRVPGA